MRGVRRITHDISDISPASFILQTELCNLLVSILGRFLKHKTLQLYGKKKCLICSFLSGHHISNATPLLWHIVYQALNYLLVSLFLSANIHVIVEKDDNVTACRPTAHGNN